VVAYRAGRFTSAVEDVKKGKSNEMTVAWDELMRIYSDNALCQILQKGILPDSVLHEFMCRTALEEIMTIEVASKGRASEQLAASLDVKRAWLRGEASDEKLNEARERAMRVCDEVGLGSVSRILRYALDVDPEYAYYVCIETMNRYGRSTFGESYEDFVKRRIEFEEAVQRMLRTVLVLVLRQQSDSE
jgi:hypothetical protein